MGVVYHTHYLDYFEAARTEALRSLGLAYKDLEAQGIIMPVTELDVQYKQPGYYDDVLEIRAMVDEMPRMRMTIRYEVNRQGETGILTTGQVSLCFIDTTRNRPVPAPEIVRSLFRKALADVE